jgi:hypothetical protein
VVRVYVDKVKVVVWKELGCIGCVRLHGQQSTGVIFKVSIERREHRILVEMSIESFRVMQDSVVTSVEQIDADKFPCPIVEYMACEYAMKRSQLHA